MTTLRCLRMRVQILIFAVKFNQVSCSCFRSDSISKIRSPKEVWNSFPKPAIFENFAERTPIKICKKKGCSKGVQIFDVHWRGISKMKSGGCSYLNICVTFYLKFLGIPKIKNESQLHFGYR